MKGPSERLPDSADVAVVGSGVAGLAAAVEASEQGAEVIVLEGADDIGGALVMSGAYCCLVDTPLQRRLGIKDNVELALEDWARVGGPTVLTPSLVILVLRTRPS